MSDTEGEKYTDEGIAQTGTKRSQDSSDGPASKKAHIDGEDDSLSIKILIPSAAVGAIIGKGGEAMRNLKTDSQCRVQMSKSTETYPGTSERICLVKGRLQNVMSVIEVIGERIREKCADNTGSDAFDHKGVTRGNEVKVVMPNTSAGMVIGKSGANIKDIRESYGCQIQVFPKAGSPEAKNSLERIVTLAHEDIPQLMQAVARVLEKVVADPHHASEISKEDFGGKAFTSPSNPGYATGGATGYTNGSGGAAGYGATGAAAGYGAASGYGYGSGGGGNFKYNPMTGLGNAELMSFLDNLQSTLRTSGFNEASVSEVMQAMQVLAKYNIMGLGLGLGVAAMAQMRTGQENMPNNHGAAGFDGGYGGGSAGDQYANFAGGNPVLMEVMRSGSGAAPNGENFAASVIMERRISGDSIELEVPDTIIGAVLGPKAKTLQDIQQYSGCKVQVHKRDSKPGLPIGTRLISLNGEEDSMRTCRMMIERVINEAQDRRQYYEQQ